ncbi:nucleoid occlusion protein [Marinococcus sp. PL1-022]|jgi:ParB family chromosome partitioning protein|uniref:nucleoid occlusion protein n=1 Tax=Marinococcus sp. PL1-022 TaxID=3095363 RepID=UPI0026092EC0|nr:nucleoid occlusion protein [Marinococcus sp. PL1-022]MDX6154350.1 nucleoid occlusion protein [Marinococcus sp. PL1-022]
MKQSIQKWFGLGDNQAEKSGINEHEVKMIPIHQIMANPFQPRTIFSDEKLSELAQSLQTHGLLQPITVRKQSGGYEIIAGERRWRASQKLGWKEIPALVKEFNDTQTASIALIENLQREALTALEEAAAYARLLEMNQLTQASLAQRLGKSQSTIANKLRLLHLSEYVQEKLSEKEITERHARALLKLPEAERQNQIVDEAIEKDWNVKQTEDKIAALLDPKPKKTKQPKKHVSRDTRIALNTIRESIDMVTKSGMAIDTDEEDYDGYYQVTIRIPKSKQ